MHIFKIEVVPIISKSFREAFKRIRKEPTKKRATDSGFPLGMCHRNIRISDIIFDSLLSSKSSQIVLNTDAILHLIPQVVMSQRNAESRWTKR